MRKRGKGETEVREKRRKQEDEEGKGTHRDLGSAGLAAVEGEAHHVTFAVQLTFAAVVVKLQHGVINVLVL